MCGLKSAPFQSFFSFGLVCWISKITRKTNVFVFDFYVSKYCTERATTQFDSIINRCQLVSLLCLIFCIDALFWVDRISCDQNMKTNNKTVLCIVINLWKYFDWGMYENCMKCGEFKWWLVIHLNVRVFERKHKTKERRRRRIHINKQIHGSLEFALRTADNIFLHRVHFMLTLDSRNAKTEWIVCFICASYLCWNIEYGKMKFNELYDVISVRSLVLWFRINSFKTAAFFGTIERIHHSPNRKFFFSFAFTKRITKTYKYSIL